MLLRSAKTITICASLLFASQSYARDNIQVVGSSTVYPFTTVIAEEFGMIGKFKTPIIESTGTGGGMKLFCSGIGEKYPDFTNASRAIKASEAKKCAQNGIKNPVEIKIGYDGIVLANSKDSKAPKLTKDQIFLALAVKVPSKGKLIANPYKKWSDIDKSLPNIGISVYGPPPTSGTRDAFVELVMEKACKDLPEFKAAYPDKKKRKKACHIIRTDNKFIEAGENDNLIVQKLKTNPNSLGIFGFSFLEQNSSSVQGAEINGVMPTFDNIIKGTYSISRPLFIYLKHEHVGLVPGVKEFAKEIVNENTIGADGYLIEKGLIPLSDEEFEQVRKNVLKKL